ncbi:MAG TPA: hypothetical protein VLF67_02980, partial [Candidatus Saccharimonas sp.]|nr:hypothetical protein [Candidatus Saccharimonas sp.]
VSTSSMTPAEIEAAYRKTGHQRSDVYFSNIPEDTFARLVPTSLVRVPSPGTRGRLLVTVSDGYTEMLLRKRMGDFADFFLHNENNRHCCSHCDCDSEYEARVPDHPFETYRQQINYTNQHETTEVVSSWRGKTLAQFRPANYADEPLGAWNPITHQPEDLASATFSREGHLVVALSDETIDSLLRAFYEPFHRALGLDLLQP